jgi:hypothetical protein
MIDANECRENAKRYQTLAAQTIDPRYQGTPFRTAQGWARLAIDFATLNDREAEWKAPQKRSA